jgi:hypothetical protein
MLDMDMRQLQVFPAKKTLNKSIFVIPAEAGIQLNQASGPRLSPG